VTLSCNKALGNTKETVILQALNVYLSNVKLSDSQYFGINT